MNPILTLPNLVSLSRILMAPLLLWAAPLHAPRLFLVVFALMIFSDFLDGFLARLLNQQTELGTQLDTAGDVLTCFCVFLGGWMLWPERVYAEAPAFILTLVMLTLSGSVTLLKYRHLPSYHTWSAKLATALAGIGLWIFLADLTPWVFRIAVGVLTLSALEEIAITLTLRKWHPNVPTFLHALRIQRLENQQSSSPG